MSKRKNADPLIAEIERALAPGKYIECRETCEFVQDLEKVQEQLEALAPEATGRAVRLFEIFLSGCYEKIEECDDSSAYLSKKKGILEWLGLTESEKSPSGPSFAERAQERWRKQTS